MAREDSATECLRRARERRATWPEPFPGFSADLVVWMNGERTEGSIRIMPDGEVEVDAAEGESRQWATDQLRSEVTHLRAGPSPFSAEAEYGEAEGEHPPGRLVVATGDRFSSTYRIKGDRFREVSRTMGDTKFSIVTVVGTENAEGKHLPSVYTVTYWEAGTGRLNKVETFQAEFARVGVYDLPASRIQVVSQDGAALMRQMLLSNHVLSSI
jgi:hypothetical protein